MLNELFIERWSLLLAAIEEADRERRLAAREARPRVAGFIVDSYRHDPELMKVIIVEVTRAANSFGRTHLPEIRRAYESIAKIVADGQEAGAFRARHRPDLRLDVLLRRDRAAALRLDLRADPGRRRRLRRRPRSLSSTTICDGLEPAARDMWESLGTTRRQDRVLHGAAKALNLLLGLVLLPAWLLGQRLAGPAPPPARAGREPAPLPQPLPAPREMAL